MDLHYGGERYNGKSTTSYTFTLSGTTVSWVSKLQKIVVLSLTEAEYVVATKAIKEFIWVKQLMSQFVL